MLPALGGREEELSPPTREMLGALRGFEPALAPYLDAFARLLALELEADAWLERHGAALCPVAPDVAPPRGRELRSGGRGARAPGRQAHAVHVRQRPRPAGRGDARGAHDGRPPVGVQLIGRHGHERALLALARELEGALGGWLDPDGP